MALVQLINGHFQDAEGNVLDSGYLTWTLSHDEQDPSSGTQIASGLPVRVILDNVGNVADTQKVWATDVLLPAGAYYIVEAFRFDGTTAWNSPQFITVPSGATYDLGTFVPSQPVAQPPAPAVTFQTNGVNNGVQNLENLVAGTNITLVNSGGNTTITSAGGPSFSTAGQGGFFGPGLFVTGDYISSVASPAKISFGTANLVTAMQFVLLATITIRSVVMQATNNLVSQNASIGIYDSTGATRLLLATGFKTLTSPKIQVVTVSPSVTLQPGIYLLAQACTTTSADTFFGIVNKTVDGVSMSNTDASRYFSAANPAVAGVVPSSLGTLTPLTSTSFGSTNGFAYPYFAP